MPATSPISGTPFARTPSHLFLSEPREPQRLLFSTAPTDRAWSRAECETLFKRISALATGDGDTTVSLRTTWTGNLRWGRNRPTSSGDTMEYSVTITRTHAGVSNTGICDKLDDATLKATVQDIENGLSQMRADPDNPEPEPLAHQEYLTPAIWNDKTAAMTALQLSDAARQSVDPVVDAQLVAAGYAEVGVATWAIFNTRGLAAYAAATGTLYTQTVRNMEGTASGWCGKTHTDWTHLDVSALSQTALHTCVKSANPVAIEPGRYTAILAPDVVSRMFSFAIEAMDRDAAETQRTVFTLTPPHGNSRGVSKIGHQVLDARLNITSDPQDPECGYMPFDPDGNPYDKVTWVENGILKALSYNRTYAKKLLGSDVALPNPRAFRVSGGDTSLDAMIADTERGVFVTNTSGFALDDNESLTLTAVTRNGLFLIERGKITKPIKNMWIRESPMTAFNNVVQLGQPERTYGAVRQSWGGALRDIPARALNDGRMPIVAPALKVTDFQFTQLTDAV